jgi:hypothetical protein
MNTKESPLVILQVTDRDARLGDISQINTLLEQLDSGGAAVQLEGKTVQELYDSCILAFPCFDADPRPNWQILEVRRFLQTLFEARPHLLYYLVCDPKLGQANMVMMALLPEHAFKARGDNTSPEFVMSEDEFALFAVGLLKPAIAFAERLGIDPKDSLSRYSRMFREETWRLMVPKLEF